MAEIIDLKVHLEINTKCTGCKMVSQSSVTEAHTTAAPSTTIFHEEQSSDIPVRKGKTATLFCKWALWLPSLT